MSSTSSITIFSDQKLREYIDYATLIPALRQGLKRLPRTPQRSHYQLEKRYDTLDPSMLIMPSWNEDYYGVKLVSIFPENEVIPSIQGVYILFEAVQGRPIAYFDAMSLTTMRTAAVSAAVSGILARNTSRNLLIMGTGKLAPELALAHCEAHTIDNVFIWGRNAEKIRNLVRFLQDKMKASIFAVDDIPKICAKMDIISTATMSPEPILSGSWVAPGTHIDLVGSYLPNTREADDILIQKSKVFIDTPTALQESGDLLIPLQRGILDDSVRNRTMEALFSNQIEGRKEDDEITIFKSVGHASEDLITATLIYENSKA